MITEEIESKMEKNYDGMWRCLHCDHMYKHVESKHIVTDGYSCQERIKLKDHMKISHNIV